MPRDPLSDSDDNWTYSPLMPGLVESRGLQTEVGLAEEPAAAAPEPQRYWSVPPPYSVLRALGPLARALWRR